MSDIEHWLKSDDAKQAVTDAFISTGTLMDWNLAAAILEHLRDAAPQQPRGAVDRIAALKPSSGASVPWAAGYRAAVGEALAALGGQYQPAPTVDLRAVLERIATDAEGAEYGPLWAQQALDAAERR